MTFDELMKAVKTLQDDERRELLALLVSLEDRATAGYSQKLAVRMDDPSSERWLTIEECEQKLGLRS